MLNSIKGLLKKQPKHEENTPSKKLWRDIQKDYYYCDELGRCKLSDQKGFLDKELFINGNVYHVVPCNFGSGTFELGVKDAAGNSVFKVVVLYGPHRSNPQQHVLYIDSFNRLTDHRCGIGKEMAEYIRKMAESRGFNVIGVHAVAAPYECKEAMNQKQLEEFYKKYLNGKNVSLKFMENSDHVEFY